MTRSSDRLRAIEQELRELKARLKHAERQQVSSSPLSLFWGQTWTPVEGDYPDNWGNVLPVVPADFTFGEGSTGTNGSLTRQRQEPIQPAHAKAFVPRGHRVLVMRDRQQKQNHIVDLEIGGKILIQNKSGSTRQRGEILGIGQVIHGLFFSPPSPTTIGYFRLPFHQGVTPVYPDHVGRWGVLLTQAEPDEVVMAMVSGIVATRFHRTIDERFVVPYDSQANLLFFGVTRLDISSDSYQLRAGLSGAAEIVRVPPGTDEGGGILVRIGNYTEPTYRLSVSAVNAGQLGEAWFFSGGQNLVARNRTGENLTGGAGWVKYDRRADELVIVGKA